MTLKRQQSSGGFSPSGVPRMPAPVTRSPSQAAMPSATQTNQPSSGHSSSQPAQQPQISSTTSSSAALPPLAPTTRAAPAPNPAPAAAAPAPAPTSSSAWATTSPAMTSSAAAAVSSSGGSWSPATLGRDVSPVVSSDMTEDSPLTRPRSTSASMESRPRSASGSAHASPASKPKSMFMSLPFRKKKKESEVANAIQLALTGISAPYGDVPLEQEETPPPDDGLPPFPEYDTRSLRTPAAHTLKPDTHNELRQLPLTQPTEQKMSEGESGIESELPLTQQTDSAAALPKTLPPTVGELYLVSQRSAHTGLLWTRRVVEILSDLTVNLYSKNGVLLSVWPPGAVLQVIAHENDTRMVSVLIASGDRRPLDFCLRSYEESARFIRHLSDATEAKSRDRSTSRLRSSYAPLPPLKVFIGSWNMGNNPPPQDLTPWLDNTNQYDLVAIGLQECLYEVSGQGASIAGLISKKGEKYTQAALKRCEQDIFDKIKKFYGPQYEVVAGLSLLEIRLIVLAKKSLIPEISYVKSATKATGVGNVLGNKGGVVVSLSVLQSNFCFVNSHLAAHQERVQDRNDNFALIVAGTQTGKLKNLDLLHQHHYVFWFGDLNYRLNLPRREVLEKVKALDFSYLVRHDQLIAARNSKDAFVGFEERTLDFPPTYRYGIGNRIYIEEKKRVPSWTDRILWKTLPYLPLKCHFFDSVDTIMTSDHSPVCAAFSVPVIPLMSPDVPLQERRSGYIEFSKMRAFNLLPADANGLADPYLRFVPSGPWLRQKGDWGPLGSYTVHKDTEIDTTEIVSATKYMTLAPVWEEGEVPLFPKIVDQSLEYLVTQYLFISVMDYDLATKDDPMGHAVFPLRDILADKPKKFSLELLMFGRPAGTLEGECRMIWR
eukprot:TRINITY_DN3382_c0_g1_i2.p1 TRINITY_DN3382_c0_g1~~TRINITY_DN3382_c0_g1_i2.p1  ORF type:complete len:886 (-),score=216.50 TRINITY_DN3382_c0_g1_i2:43-2700(-)